MSDFFKTPVGEVRSSQAIHTFGVGALVDLPRLSAIVMGLDEWDPPQPKQVIAEERLLGLIRTHLGDQVEMLVSPPPKPEGSGPKDPTDPQWRRGLPVSPFPRWARCPVCDLIAPLDSGLFELKTGDVWQPDRTRFVHRNCEKAKGRPPEVVPMRFIVTCEAGHVDDFPWVEFVHGGPTKCKSLLRLREFGVSAEAADIVVKCDTCGASRPMTEAFGDHGSSGDKKKGDKPQKYIIGSCRGFHPHLRHRAKKCNEDVRAILAGATNLWFPVTVSAISIPEGKSVLEQRVREAWGVLEAVTSREVLAFARKQPGLETLMQYSDEEIWEASESYREGSKENKPADVAELKRAEWEIFSDPKGKPTEKDFRMREVSPPKGWGDWIFRVVQVERLRVVQALTGFTRIVNPGDFTDPSEIPEQRRVTIARKPPAWVPAAETRGEGIFIQLREEAIRAWLQRPAVAARDAEFRSAHEQFRRARGIPNPTAGYPGLRYVLLHSLSHALLRQFSIECGYGAASLTERIYASGEDGEPMAGVLLYTAAADSEGTLGGLVALAEPEALGRHLFRASSEAGLCASDPLCAEHSPGDDVLGIHGAECHACGFAAETSCERGNKYLDRALLVNTVAGPDVAFFDGFDE